VSGEAEATPTDRQAGRRTIILGRSSNRRTDRRTNESFVFCGTWCQVRRSNTDRQTDWLQAHNKRAKSQRCAASCLSTRSWTSASAWCAVLNAAGPSVHQVMELSRCGPCCAVLCSKRGRPVRPPGPGVQPLRAGGPEQLRPDRRLAGAAGRVCGPPAGRARGAGRARAALAAARLLCNCRGRGRRHCARLAVGRQVGAPVPHV
jgi:hypothetical protein